MGHSFEQLLETEKRFQKPYNLKYITFENNEGRTLRGAISMPPSGKPKAVVIVLNGLSEFIEKYYETAHTLHDMDCAFAMIDWQGQGHSHRYLENPHQRHSEGFDKDVDDLDQFITGHINTNADIKDLPKLMIAHSMGGNIGLRYLTTHPSTFKAAAFSAPLNGIYAIKSIPQTIKNSLASTLHKMFNTHYAPLGTGDWKAATRDIAGDALFSNDPKRKIIHNGWCLKDPKLQVGHVTNGWVYHAIQSCKHIFNKVDSLASLKIPFLFACAGKDYMVDNNATERLLEHMPSSKYLNIPKSRHEILMESDDIRNKFYDEFKTMLFTVTP